MADGVGITEGVDKTVATDDIGGAHHQKVKMEFGADNTATQVNEDNPLPVTGTLVTEKFDYIGISYPSDTTEVFAYKTGGAGGTLVATVTVVYTNATKERISSATRT